MLYGIQYDIPHNNSVIEASYKWEFTLTRNTPYLTLTGEVWGVCCEDENWF